METNRNVIRKMQLKKWYPPYYDEGCFEKNIKRRRGFNKCRRPIYSLEYRYSRSWKHNRSTQHK